MRGTRRVAALTIALSWALSSMGCADRSPVTTSPKGTGGADGGAGTTAGGSGGAPTVSYSCDGDDCPACANGTACASDQTAWIDDTCCAAGDALVELGETGAPEAVDVVSNGTIAVLCGGFGASIIDVTNRASPTRFARATARCQNAAIGSEHAGRTQVVLSHHGDSWVTTPSLSLFGVNGTTADPWVTLEEPGVLYEGVAVAADHVFVAAHDGGLRVYAMPQPTTLIHEHTVTGLDNAWEVTTSGTFAYVADYEAGAIAVVDIETPAAAAVVSSVPTTGPPRHVSVHGSRLYVSAGGFGVDVFDISSPAAPALVGNIAVRGSAQAAAANDDIIAVAAWSHVATYAADTFRLIATERTGGYPSFEQDLGVDVVGDDVFVAEWEKLHVLQHRPGMITPDLWVEEKQFMFSPDAPDIRAVVVENRGDLPLTVSDISVNAAQYTVPPTGLTVPAGAGDAFEVSFAPPALNSTATLAFATNDPDPFDSAFRAGLVTNDTNALDVGDPLTDAFGFLDPNGANDVAGLDGKVIVLAYFALF